MVEPKTTQLLHVEDDDICRIMLGRAFKKAKIANPIIGARDGIDALEMLRGTNGRERLSRPYLILLDLHMPRMNGIEFLKELRQDRELRQSVVFVLTTSDADEDDVNAHDLGVAGFIPKYDPADAFLESTALLDTCWRVVDVQAA